MSITKVNVQMEKLKQLHESLLYLSREKTELLKQGETGSLQQLLTQERKHIQAITKIENERMHTVTDWCPQQGIELETPTLSGLLGFLEDSKEKNLLQSLFEDLAFLVSELKQQEQLNAELTKQSLQFIHLSLDMLQPSLNNVNYNKQTGVSNKEKRSVFDSKA
ncbi:FlgN protein [Thalassobacillus cyri]|uniref:FlgN protein n=1 Tax=Thalassobacillus cyri TaxID=571932 RepID=A0A1H4AUW4_9BACI|nr:FlgN protein [Thalassobacillus cyri]